MPLHRKCGHVAAAMPFRGHGGIFVIEHLGPHTRAYRLERGMTQEELGDAVDCTKSMISLIVTRQAWLSIKLLAKIAKALGVQVSYFADP